MTLLPEGVMSTAVQLEFNFDDKNPEEMQLHLMQKQIDEFCQSMDKVRRKLFSELGEMKKVCASLQKENEDLKATLKEIKHGKTQETDGQADSLFDVREYQEVAS